MYIVAIVLIGLGLAMFGFGMYFVRQADASTSWPSVEGTVQQVHIRGTRTGTNNSASPLRYHASVRYRYEVGGTSYTSNRYSLGDGDRMGKRYETRKEARAAVPYRSGGNITVYYDPAAPAESVLQTGANWGTYMPQVLGLLFMIFGALLIRTASN